MAALPLWPAGQPRAFLALTRLGHIPAGRSPVLEVYPSLWRHSFAREGRSPGQHDAYPAAAWMRSADLDGNLGEFLHPSLTPAEGKAANFEGWIMGIK